MPRFHARPEGDVPFTAAEEAQRDAEEEAFANQPPPPPTRNQKLRAELKTLPPTPMRDMLLNWLAD